MFDAKRFMQTAYQAREEDVQVPDLREYFGPDENPVWRVRGLTGQELGAANQAGERNRNIEAILAGVASANLTRKSEAISALIGRRDEAPDDVVKRMEMLTIGSVSPVCDLPLAVKLCTVHPIEFFHLTQAIARLTGMGQTAKKKPTSSGET